MRAITISGALAATIALVLPSTPASVSTSAYASEITPQIVGGSYVSSAPWAAALYRDGRVWCSGTIIAARWVLTAQHCTMRGGTYTVRVGNVRHANGKQAKVSRIVQSPSSDLSLLNLDRTVSTTYVKLASNDPPVGSTNNIYGWGTLNNTDPTSPLSDRLKTATVRVTRLNDVDYFNGRAIRSVGRSGTTGWGDSGGPQLYNGKQVGVCSTGTNTEQTYASVTANRAWIRAVSGT